MNVQTNTKGLPKSPSFQLVLERKLQKKNKQNKIRNK